MRPLEGDQSGYNNVERRGSETSRQDCNKLQKSSTDSEDDPDENSGLDTNLSL